MNDEQATLPDIWEETEEEVKPKRHEYCGMKFLKIDSKKPDKLKEFTYICNDHRNCTWCAMEKARKEKDILYSALIKEETNLVVARLDDDEAKIVMRRLRDNDTSYRCIPQSDNQSIILHCDESQPGQVIDNEDDFHKLPLKEWVQAIPEKRRVSGRKHMVAKTVAKVKEDGEAVNFWTFALWTNAPKEVQKECWQQAVKEIPIHDPCKCVVKRMRRFKELLEQKEHVTYCVPILETIYVENEIKQLEMAI